MACLYFGARHGVNYICRMNTVLTFLEANRQRLDLAHYGTPDRLSCVILTPRFRASGHVVFLVLADGRPAPALVAKVSRLSEAGASLQREAASLRAVQAARPGGFNSIPRVIAFEECVRHPILIETALVGEPMDRLMVRRDLTRCCEAALDWLTEVARSNPDAKGIGTGWFERLVEQPLDQLARAFPGSAGETSLLSRTRDLVAPLSDAALPLVVEHGDLSHPNILWLDGGGLGVIDWELAKLRGLPTYDLFFFLTYAAFARRNASKNQEYVSAFQAAFFGPSAWARPYVRAYAERLGVPSHALTPLFVLCWVRYLAGLLTRLGEADHSDKTVGVETVAWLRGNRYYALWRHTLAHVNELVW